MEEVKVTCIKWMLLFLLVKEGREQFKGKVGFELKPKKKNNNNNRRERRERIKGKYNTALP